MGNNPADLLSVDSRTGVITLRNRVTMEQYQMLRGKYQGTILSIDGKKSASFPYAGNYRHLQLHTF